MFYPVTIQNNKINPFNIQVHGFFVKHAKETYLIVPHLGMDVKCITIFDTFIDNFIYAEWNDIIVAKYTPSDDIFVFTKLSTKRINTIENLQIDSNDGKYLEHTYFPINMIPDNLLCLYYVIETNNSILTGLPVYHNNNVIGVCVRAEDNINFVLPSIYIIKTIERLTNKMLYLPEFEKITKIDNYLVNNYQIYSRVFNMNIDIGAYINLFSDDKEVKIIINSEETVTNYVPFQEKIDSKLLHYNRLYNPEKMEEMFEEFDNFSFN